MPSKSKRFDKLAAKEYTLEISRELKKELDRERTRLSKGSYVFCAQDHAKFRSQRTFNIDLEGFSGAFEQDSIVVNQLLGESERVAVARGFISSIRDGKVKIILYQKPKFQEEKDSTEGSKFEVTYDVAQFEERANKFRWAVDSLESANMSPHILNCLLSHYEERNNTKFIKTRVLNLDNSPRLSKKQKLAVEQSLMKRISLIEGVPGSGKTLVAANIAYSMSRIHKERRKVLLCSPIQSTVNQLASLLASQENPGIVVQLTPDTISDRWDKSYDPKLCLKESSREEVENRWIRRVQWHLDFTFSLYKKSSKLLLTPQTPPHVSEYRIKRAERSRLKEADIVCCTLEQALSNCLRDIDFKAVIIDDAQYATECECLLAIKFKSIKQVTLIGDMRRSEQLVSHSMRSGRNRSMDRRANKNRYERRSSFIADSRLRRALALPNGLNHTNPLATAMAPPIQIGSLFDRWLARGLPSVVLKFRYRKINKLDAFLRQYSYPFDTCSNLSVGRRVSSIEQPLENGKCPEVSAMACALFDVDSSQFKDTIQRLLDDIDKWNGTASVSIITNQSLEKCELRGLDCGCVGDYLGQQRDYVILLGKKSSKESRAIKKYRVHNDYMIHDDSLMIASTRASHGLFIITDLKETILDCVSSENKAQHSSAGDGWKSLVQYCREENLVLQEYPKV